MDQVRKHWAAGERRLDLDNSGCFVHLIPESFLHVAAFGGHSERTIHVYLFQTAFSSVTNFILSESPTEQPACLFASAHESVKVYHFKFCPCRIYFHSYLLGLPLREVIMKRQSIFGWCWHTIDPSVDKPVLFFFPVNSL